MNALNEISDEEFVSFLHGLGVESYKKSFEWMLSDPDFSGVLRWLYNNLDHNNALTDREKYRYLEHEKKGSLSPEELEQQILLVQTQCAGICLPGDQNGLEDMKHNIQMQKERLAMLEKQESMINELIKKNELSKEELTQELTRLNSAQLQSEEDNKLLSEQCLALAEQTENIMEGVVDVVGATLNMYASANNDKDTASKFFTFGPFEAYRQSQALYRSHFDLYVCKKFNKKQDEIDEDLRNAVVEAKILETRLYEAVLSYIDAEADLAGEQAKLAFVSNYTNVHPNQLSLLMVEAQSSLQLLEQEESILELEIEQAAREFVEQHTKQVIDNTKLAAIAVREEILSSLNFLVDTTTQARCLDLLVSRGARLELTALHELIQFSSQLRDYLIQEGQARTSMIESMNEICAEQKLQEQKIQSDNTLLSMLFSILKAPIGDCVSLVKLYEGLHTDIKEAKDSIDDGFTKRENALKTFVTSTVPLHNYVFSGCTKQPSCWCRQVSALLHAVRHSLDRVDSKVLEASGKYWSVKNGDKHGLRKLWQWFLTDQRKLLSALNKSHSRSCLQHHNTAT